MSLYSSAERKNGYSSSGYKLPELTQFEKKVRRIEMLLLENPTGFYKSHIKAYMRATSDQELDEVLNTIEAKDLDGFIVHPHFYFNIRYNGATIHVTRDNDVTASQIIDLIDQNPEIPVHRLMKVARLYDPEDLKKTLLSRTGYEHLKSVQHIASCYLLRHFNIRKVVHKL